KGQHNDDDDQQQGHHVERSGEPAFLLLCQRRLFKPPAAGGVRARTLAAQMDSGSFEFGFEFVHAPFHTTCRVQLKRILHGCELPWLAAPIGAVLGAAPSCLRLSVCAATARAGVSSPPGASVPVSLSAL